MEREWFTLVSQWWLRIKPGFRDVEMVISDTNKSTFQGVCEYMCGGRSGGAC